MSTTQIPPRTGPELDEARPIAAETAVPDAPPPEWETPPDSPGPINGLTVGLGVLILLVTAFIIGAGVTGSVWLLVIGFVALVAALAVLLGELMHFIT
jgi:VIT1/CCC1 family predicted Fe2+/Mn2+ transporter